MKGKKIVFALRCLFGACASMPAGRSGAAASFVWRMDRRGRGRAQVPAAQIEQLASERANILREYGINGGERRDYANGTGQLTVTLYRMVDPSAAFGAFTFLRDPDMARGRGEQARVLQRRGARANAARGRQSGDGCLLRQGPDGRRRHRCAGAERRGQGGSAALSARSVIFCRRMGSFPVRNDTYSVPRLWRRHFRRERSSHADWAGFGSSAEAIVGRYRLPGQNGPGEALLLLMLYPTQQLARRSLHGDKQGVCAQRRSEPGKWPAALIWHEVERADRSAFRRRVARVAANFLNQIHYASDVTWDEPTHELTDPSISTIVVGAIVDTGAIMLLVLAASLGFGGFRIWHEVLCAGKDVRP